MNFALKTGANGFFYFRSQEDWDERGIPRAFVRPLLKHAAQTEFTEVHDRDLDWFVFDANDFVQGVLQERDLRGRDPEEVVKEALARNGYMDVLEYIREGEEEEIHERASVQGRPVWFNLGELPTPPIVLQKEYWRDRRALLNRAAAAVDQRLYKVVPRATVDVSPTSLGALLNSSVTALMREMHGRTEQGQGMNRNTLATYEAEELPVPDPRLLDEESVREIEDRFEDLVGREREVGAEEIEELRRELDRAVLDALGMEAEATRLWEAVEGLVEIREAGAGQHTTRMVEPVPDEGRRVELRGARRVAGGGGGELQLGFDGM